jgi:hypothetical protein
MRMRMSFTGSGNENDRYRMVAEHGNGLCAGRRESERQNTVRGMKESERQNREWQNAEWPTIIAALISSRDFVIMHDKIILFNWNMENHSKKVQL